MTQNVNDNNSSANAFDDEIIDNLVKHILSLKVDLKSRRYDEEAQTDDVKEQWLKRTLKNDPALFLEKWGKHLKQSDLNYFDPLKDDYEIAYHLKSLRKTSQHNNSNTLNNSTRNPYITNKIIRNRRYNYVQRHPEYFTLENLQERNPYEYEEYIGQYIPEDKRVEFQPFQNNMSLVERMYFDIDHQRMNDEIEEMEDILYQEEEKEKEEDKKDNELIKEKERKKREENENENENEINEKRNKEKNDELQEEKTNIKVKINENECNNNKNNISLKNEKEIEQENNQRNPTTFIENENNKILAQPKIPTQINDNDILKLSDKNHKFYQIINAMEEEDFEEEEDDSDEEYNEETILKEIERRRELKRQEQALKKEQKKKDNSNSSNDIKRNKTKIRIINPSFYDNNNNYKTKTNTTTTTINNNNINNDNNNNTVSNKNRYNINEKTIPQSKEQIQSINDIFNVTSNDEYNDKNERTPKREIEEEKYNDEEGEEISEELKQYYYNEFINIMKKEFIDGNDKNFDYSIVDNCDDYDDIQMYEQDMHERYFEDNDELFYSNHHQNIQKRYYDERPDDMEDVLAEESYFDYD